MSTAENKEFIRHLFTEMSNGNVNAYLESLAEDGRFTIIGTTTYSGTFQGKQAFIDRVLAPLGAQPILFGTNVAHDGPPCLILP